MRLTVNSPPPPADPRDLAASFEDAGDEFAEDLDTGELLPAALADPVVGGPAAGERRAGIRRPAIAGAREG